jgi:hypothetical protein
MSKDLIILHYNTACTFLIKTYSCLFMFTDRTYTWLLLMLDKVILLLGSLIVFHFFCCCSCCCCFDLSPTYNHNKIKGILSAKNMPIVRIGIRKTNKDIPKHIVAEPRVKIQRFVRLSTIYRIQAPPFVCSFSYFLLVFRFSSLVHHRYTV